jgi:hypothetical protein
MTALALTLLIVGGGVFAVIVIYALIDYKRTGVLYRKKKLIFPTAIVSFVIFAVGFILVPSVG